jgi:thymidylate synthase
MEYLQGKNCYELWLKCVSSVLKKGKKLQDDKDYIYETNNLFIETDNLALENESYHLWYESEYKDLLNSLDMFDYKTRLLNFSGIKQIDNIISKLKKYNESKSAIATTFFPSVDILKIPCLITLDFKIRNEKLNCVAFFRSQDIWKKQPLNFKLIIGILNLISDQINVRPGNLSLFITSAHIYSKDLDLINKLIII